MVYGGKKQERRPPKDPGNPSPSYGKTFPADHLRREEITAMLNVLDRDDPVSIRNRTLIVTLWRSGLRISEALALRPSDIDLEGRTIRVLHGKGNKARTVGIDSGAVTAIREWLPVRDEWIDRRTAAPASAPIFPTRKGGPLATAYIRAMLPRVAKEAGVERRVHAHIFRHTFAVELMREGVRLSDIQRLLGHSSVATTSNYLESLSPEDALNAVRERKW